MNKVFLKPGIGSFNALRLGVGYTRMQMDPGNGGGGTEAEAALLQKVKDKVADELKTRNYQNATEVQGLVNKALEGLPLEALRNYEKEGEEISKLPLLVRNIAAELEKVKNLRVGKDMSKEDKKLLRRALSNMLNGIEGKPSEVELLMQQRQQGRN